MMSQMRIITILLTALPTTIFAFAPPSATTHSLRTTFTPKQRSPISLQTTFDKREKDLSAEQLRAFYVFNRIVGTSSSQSIGPTQLTQMLLNLDIDATDEESAALFKYLDVDGSGCISFYEEFLPWYDDVALTSQSSAESFQETILSRRTVHEFDDTPVDDGVIKRAIECAIAAPNRLLTEPWRFIQLGPKTISKVEELQKASKNVGDANEGAFVKFTNIPGWLVVTTKVSPGNALQEQEDMKSVCCAVQNLMLSLWSEGIGSKWTFGPVQRTDKFAEICGVDTKKEKVAGVIWYGFASGGLKNVDVKCRKLGVDDVLKYLP